MLCAGVLLVSAMAYAADLPERLFKEDVAQVWVVDLTRFSREQLRAAAKTVLGDKADVANVIEAGLMSLLQGPVDAGATGFAQASTRTNGTATMPMFFIEAKPENQQAVEQAVRKVFGQMTKLEGSGNWLMGTFGRSQTPATMPVLVESPLVREAFAATSDRALRHVMIPSEKERKEIAQEGKGEPETVRSFLAALVNSRYVALAVDLGEKPAIEAVACMPDEAAAAKLVEAARALATTTDANLAAFKPLLAALRPQQQGKMVRLLINTQELAAVGKEMGPMLETMQRASDNRAAAERQAAKAPLPEPTRAASAAQMRLVLQQIITFDRKNRRLPADLDELLRSGIVPDGGMYEMMNPRTNEERGYLYVKPQGANRLADIKDAGKTPILYESDEGKAAADSLIGYADGHVEGLQKTDNGDKGP